MCQGATELTQVDYVQGADINDLAERVAHVLRTYAVPDARAGTSFALYAVTPDGARVRRFAGPWPVKVTAADIEEGNAVLTTPFVAAGVGQPDATTAGWIQYSGYLSQQLIARDATVAERDESMRQMVQSVVGSIDAVQRACAAVASQATAMTAPLERALSSEREARVAAEALLNKQQELIERLITTAEELQDDREERAQERKMFFSMVADVLGIKVPTQGKNEPEQ